MKSPYKTLALLKVLFVLPIGGGADKTDLPSLQIGLEHIGNVEGSAAHRARPHDIVDLVDIDNGLFLAADAVHDLFEPILKVPSVLCTRQQTSQIQGKYFCPPQRLWNLAFLQQPCQTIGDGGFSHPWLPYVERVVFLLAAENLHGPLQLFLPADKGICLVHHIVQTDGILLPVRILFPAALPPLLLFPVRPVLLPVTGPPVSCRNAVFPQSAFPGNFFIENIHLLEKSGPFHSLCPHIVDSIAFLQSI